MTDDRLVRVPLSVLKTLRVAEPPPDPSVPPIPDGYGAALRVSYPDQEALIAFLTTLLADLTSGAAVLERNTLDLYQRLGSEEVWADAERTHRVTVENIYLDSGDRLLQLAVSYTRPQDQRA